MVPGDAAVTVHRGSPTAAADAPLRSGDGLTVDRGTAIIQTSTGRLFARKGTRINFGDISPRIVRGDVLAVGNHMRVGTKPANLVVSGVTRIRQALSSEIASYDGATSVRTAAEEFALESLRRIVVVGAAGSASGRVTPLTLDEADVWDREYLGVALELDRALSERSRGISLQTDGTGAHLKARVMSALSPWSDLVPLGENAVGEAVVAAEIASAARLSEADLREMLLWRADGAAWGLIAYQLGMASLPPELPGVDETAVAAVSVAPVPTTAVVAGAPKSSAAPTTTTPPSTGPRFNVPGAGAVKAPPATAPTTLVPEPVVVNPLGGVVNGVGNVLGGLLGGK